MWSQVGQRRADDVAQMPTAFRIKNAKCSTAIGREQKAYWSTLSSRETVLTHARACCRRRYTPKVQGSKVLSRQARRSKNSIHIQPDSHLDVLSSTALLALCCIFSSCELASTLTSFQLIDHGRQRTSSEADRSMPCP